MSSAAPIPPSEADVVGRAERAVALAGPEAQATVWWEWDAGNGAGWGVEVVVLRDGRVGVAERPGAEDADLAAAAEAAEAAAVGGPEGLKALPDPVAGRAHQGYDPSVLRHAAAGGRAGAAKAAVVSTRGVRAFEQRSFASARVGPLEVAAISAAALPAEPAAHPDDTGEGRAAAPLRPPAATLPVVLGPAAVAGILDLLRPSFGRPGALPLGRRVAAACISLSDSPRFAGTLPRSYDVHGVPRSPVPLIQDGVAHRLVSHLTGHAVRAGHAEAAPAHFVLVGGGAASEAELMAPIELGAYLPALDLAFLVEDGRIAGPLALGSEGVEVDPLAVLASTQALTAQQRTIPTPGTARTVGATVCPALRATAGITFATG